MYFKVALIVTGTYCELLTCILMYIMRPSLFCGRVKCTLKLR